MGDIHSRKSRFCLRRSEISHRGNVDDDLLRRSSWWIESDRLFKSSLVMFSRFVPSGSFRKITSSTMKLIARQKRLGNVNWLAE